MKKIAAAIFAVLLLPAAGCWAGAKAEIVKHTLSYAQKSQESLYMDIYSDSDLHGKRPCIIFMFGGGFSHGTRDNADYLQFFEYMASQGYLVASIDYRLGLKDVGRQPGLTPDAFIGLFLNTLDMAVEDLFEATAYLIGNAERLGVDTEKIVACGSSAGAVSVLQGEYAICKNSPRARRLPSGFNYAGVISFAGAVFETGGLTGSSYPCPVMLFHGDADANVPYDKVTESGLGFYGSKYIAGMLSDLRIPYWFYSVENAAHEMAVDPMTDNRAEIISFLDKFVHQKQRLEIETNVKKLDAAGSKKDFTIMDYIRSNFGE